MLRLFASTLEIPVQIELRGEVKTLCPFDGQEDSAEICVMYQPNATLLEMASFGAFLRKLGGEKIAHEELAVTVYRTIESELQPRWLMVTDDFERDGVSLRVRVQSDLPERGRVRPS